MKKPISINECLASSDISKLNNNNVSNVNNNINNVSNVDDLSLDELFNLIENKFSYNQKSENFLPELLAKELDDVKSINYYIKISKEYDRGFLLECLNITKSAQKEGGIRKPAAYFVGILKKKKS